MSLGAVEGPVDKGLVHDLVVIVSDSDVQDPPEDLGLQLPTHRFRGLSMFSI